MARSGQAGFGTARIFNLFGEARYGQVWPGRARLGMVRQGEDI